MICPGCGVDREVIWPDCTNCAGYGPDPRPRCLDLSSPGPALQAVLDALSEIDARMERGELTPSEYQEAQKTVSVEAALRADGMLFI